MKILDTVKLHGKLIFFFISAAVVFAFLHFSSELVEDLSKQERSRMQIWADATKEVATITGDSDSDSGNIDFLLSIIEGNTNIPVLLTDDSGNIILHRNFDLPEPVDSLSPLEISSANAEYLREKLEYLRHTRNVIHIYIDASNTQHLYYEDSRLLRNLSLYPYIQLAVMAAFILVVYFAVSSSKRAEQNKVWVGLSTETAHQLGTPISSLMAWLQLLESDGVNSDIIREMDKDVSRLSTIASRFSKIGSKPGMESADLNPVLQKCVVYMSSRTSSRVKITTEYSPTPLPVNLSEPLMEWVVENLIKNAVDAMEGVGNLRIVDFAAGNNAVIEITDSGKGIPRKNHKRVFSPGYTTKKRGWGLGLTLAKRIVEQYHSGRIMVKWSEPGKGTTFRIELPLTTLQK